MTRTYCPIPADEVLDRFSPERRARIDARALQLIAEEAALSDLRKVQRLTQAELAHALGTKQAHVSRFEKRTDVKLSNLRQYVEAIGADLALLVTLPDGTPYKLTLPAGRRRKGDHQRRAAKPKVGKRPAS